jgi:hypothetical protein
MVVDGGLGILVPDTYANAPSELVFNNVGDACHLMFSATVGWVYLGGTITFVIP